MTFRKKDIFSFARTLTGIPKPRKGKTSCYKLRAAGNQQLLDFYRYLFVQLEKKRRLSHPCTIILAARRDLTFLLTT